MPKPHQHMPLLHGFATYQCNTTGRVVLQRYHCIGNEPVVLAIKKHNFHRTATQQICLQDKCKRTCKRAHEQLKPPRWLLQHASHRRSNCYNKTGRKNPDLQNMSQPDTHSLQEHSIAPCCLHWSGHAAGSATTEPPNRTSHYEPCKKPCRKLQEYWLTAACNALALLLGCLH